MSMNLRDNAELYGTESSLDAVELYRRSFGLKAISSNCFKAAGISAVLIDDGLRLDKKQDLQWHRNFVSFVGRILRIEHLAEEILDGEMPDGSTWTLDGFTETFKLGTFMSLPHVANEIVGLKSIAAYRSGLEINPHVTKEDAEAGLSEVLESGKPVRIANKSLIDYIFTLSLEIACQFDFPLQIHTGFGDKDLDLRLSNPLHLRKLLEDRRFSRCPIVLLHASYPFSKEASYLASIYALVYLDFGLAIPKLSVHGMISSVKELLELAPIKKVMFSTDAYATPETYYLGAKRARENAIQLYKIDIGRKPFDSKASESPNSYMIGTNVREDSVSLVRIVWVDTSGQHRCRVVQKKLFDDVVKKNGVGLTFACMAMSSGTDAPSAGTNLTVTGQIRLMPDLSTMREIPWTKQEEMVLADMHLRPGEPWKYCPREALRRVSKILKDEFNLVMNAGFESDFFLLKKLEREGKEDSWVPIDLSLYCSSSAFDAVSTLFKEIVAALNSLNVPVEQLHAEAGHGQFELVLGHSACTYAADNLILTREAVRAVANKHGLLATFVPKYALDDVGSGSHVHLSLWKNGRNVFTALDASSQHGMSKIGEELMAGVLAHLPSILAFIASVPNSYARIQPDTWSGAYWCWGKENREAPIRTACPPGIPHGLVSNFEIKSFDGCANPHFGLAAILAAGIDGLRNHLPLPEPIDENPAILDGKLPRLPMSLSESVEALENDNVLREMIGEKLFTVITGVRKAEIEYYSRNKEAYKKLIHKLSFGGKLVTESVFRTALVQYGLKSVEFIPNYLEPRNMPWCAKVDMDKEKQPEVVISTLSELPFMMSGMPRPVRDLLLCLRCFGDCPRKPGRQLHVHWLDPSDPNFEVANNLKQLVKKHVTGNPVMLKVNSKY
ncbi:glutamate-ammonia ligase isoform 2 [Hibiscus syriacus]|uniref:Glutamate-ammonia ligase isoform 2 n=1 Tax=Hibiscus syriacus TaxID=106335 RepID=A0A6A3B9Y2_HIBSY|nr:glutamate-ammonia ligase isoform 2 [Hibiscus syriacus]